MAGGPRHGTGDGKAGRLAGKRVLIVEDEFFVALEVEEALQSFGCDTVGPFLNLEKAMAAADREDFDLAVLDINLDRTMAYPLADELNEKKIPFVFVTGYAENDLPKKYRLEVRVQKPFAFFELRRAIEDRLSWNDPPRS
ncbi:response regulator [Parvularcula marina]|uniref:Response regulator n=1 Tax=Parvularcula marina TaxID=2292771 RepID=A0A371RJL0_9PROT|nr:response regulator [Parvularcula marina]RFB05633.1 response regulator [Parvularcula marina]